MGRCIFPTGCSVNFHNFIDFIVRSFNESCPMETIKINYNNNDNDNDNDNEDYLFNIIIIRQYYYI